MKLSAKHCLLLTSLWVLPIHATDIPEPPPFWKYEPQKHFELEIVDDIPSDTLTMNPGELARPASTGDVSSPATGDSPASDSSAAVPASPSFPEMLDIPAGTFTMGCVDGRDNMERMEKCVGDETPAHKIGISAFQMASTETTVVQFRTFVEATGYKTTAEERGSCWSQNAKGLWNDVKGNSWREPGFQQTDNSPVVCVSWNDAQAYAKWLGKKTGQAYRLPTEAEWEYAARGGEDNTYSWGNDVGNGNANCGSGCGDTFEHTAPAGSFAKNPFGLYDMNGNVWEWCFDWYDGKYYASSPADDPKGASGGTEHVFRGGSWYNRAQIARSAYRLSRTPIYRGSYYGFRVAL